MNVGRIEYSPDYRSQSTTEGFRTRPNGIWNLNCSCGAQGISFIGPFEKCPKCGRRQKGTLKLVKKK